MLLAPFLLSLVVPIQYVWALNITFPSPPTAAQNNTFLWMREQSDPLGEVWLRKQTLEDGIGAIAWSIETVQLNLTKSAGSAQIHFNHAGLFYVRAFETEDKPRLGNRIVPISTKQFTISVNPTSAGAITGTLPTPPPVSASSLVGSPSNPVPSNGAKRQPNIAVIVGLTVGFGIPAIIRATIFYFCHRCQRISEMKLPSVTPFSDTKDYEIMACMDIIEWKRQMIGQRERLEWELEVYEQVSQELNSRTGTVPGGINGSNQEDDVVQLSRRQLELLTQWIVALEAVTMAPPAAPVRADDCNSQHYL